MLSYLFIACRKFTLRVLSSFKMQRSEETRSMECSICLDVLRDPLRLPCRHTFCTQCLRQLFADHRGDRCPLCRSDVPVSVQEALGFPRDERGMSNDGAQHLPRVVQTPAELNNRRIYHVGLGERELPNGQGMPRHVPMVNAIANGRDVPVRLKMSQCCCMTPANTEPL